MLKGLAKDAAGKEWAVEIKDPEKARLKAVIPDATENGAEKTIAKLPQEVLSGKDGEGAEVNMEAIKWL